jgi:glycosyltransferase involved in cell wall biosynthesis
LNSFDYPKVLFVTPCAFNRLTGGGITFSNLFRGWPQDRIATIHRDSVPVSTEVCSRYYRLGWNELTPSIPFSGGILSFGHLSRALEAWIEAFAPEVIYTILGTLGYLDLVRAIGKRFHVPVVAHLMDEGVTNPQPSGWLSSWTCKRYGQAQRTILIEAAARLGICEMMSEAYAERFGLPFETFMNTVDMKRFPPRAAIEQGKVLRLIYTGSVLSFSQEQSLRDVCDAVTTLFQSGVNLRLDIYTPLNLAVPFIQSMEHSKCVYVHDAIQEDSIYFKTLQEADILVSPINFDARSVHFIRYSMPTKIPSYLSSGTPILVYGPPEVAQVAYAEKDKWALVVNRRNSDLLQKAILALADDLILRKSFSQAAIATAWRNHDSTLVKERFRKLLAKAAHG